MSTSYTPPDWATFPLSMSAAKPVLKWVGGKRALLPLLQKHLPSKFGNYHEPFVGGGALFFDTVCAHSAMMSSWGRRSVNLGDANERLVRMYKALAEDPAAVISVLQGYPYSRDFFDELRARDVDAMPDAEAAAWMIYLNKTGFNGLYRVNRKNVFNVPFGKYTSQPNHCDVDGLLAASKRLVGAHIRHEDFGEVLSRAASGDFVYFDPPYVPPDGKPGFTAYTGSKFGMEEQERLALVARGLRDAGVHVLLSNADTASVRRMYEGFQIETVMVKRSVNSKASGRGAVPEVLISSKPTLP